MCLEKSSLFSSLFLFFLLRRQVFKNPLSELDLHVLFHLLIGLEVQFIVIFSARKITIFGPIAPTYLRPHIIFLTFVVLFRQILALIFYIDIPVIVFDENRYILMAEIPSNIIIIVPVFRVLNRKCKVTTAKAAALLALILLALFSALFLLATCRHNKLL